jgi:formyl transferase-like protein
MAATERVVLLAGDGPSTPIVYHALRREFAVHVIVEARQSRLRLLRRRLSRLGVLTVVGQLLFMTLIEPWLRLRSSRRIAAIKRELALDDSPIDGPILRVPSVNSAEARTALRELAPAVVVVNGTRVIDAATLDAIAAPIINTHLGITPLYRGVHGAYWALAEGRPDLAGTTVHLVDGGIDSGAIIAQATIGVTKADSYATYPYLQIAAGLPLLLDAVRSALAGRLEPRSAGETLASKLRSHPTLWGYAAARITRGIK